ncbi:MAG: hypothetical protein KME03_02315 [Aphanocapsa lilacina HA4352-LM1]|jgi:tetratricopeptide (TPR) repeat protein|nr:hypothetical protein [Aphanocapsa lilacina HA4352-LM1]
MANTLRALGAGAVCCALMLALQADRLAANRAVPRAFRADSPPLPAFGHRNLAADWLWLRFVQYLGDHRMRRRLGYTDSYTFIESINRLNPHFEPAYLLANLSVAYGMGRPDLAERLLARGLRHNPDSIALWQSRGFVHFLYSGNHPLAANCLRRAAGLAAVRLGAAGQLPANQWWALAKHLESAPAINWTRRTIWQEIYANAGDEPTRRTALAQLSTLGVVPTADGRLRARYSLYPPTGYLKSLANGPPAP